MQTWHAPFQRVTELAVRAACSTRSLSRDVRATPQPRERDGMTIVEVARPVTGGVDTHLDVHVAATLDHIGGLLGVESFPTTPAGYRSLVDWMNTFGPLHRVGVEGTGA